ncbi:MAG: helix-turn-helix domain-containing protein [Pseudomonadota bacterium]
MIELNRPDPQWVRVNDVSEMLSVSTRTVERWAANGDFIPGMRVNGTRVWDRQDVISWMRAQSEQVA